MMEQIAELLASYERVELERNPDRHSLAHEIARRITENYKVVGMTGIYKQILLVLFDYRNHAWASKTLTTEGGRLTLAERIMEIIRMSSQPIHKFSGKFRFLSNFFPADVEFEGVVYPTVEHAFQAAKSLDTKVREKIQRAATPGDAKRMGRSCRLREDWEKVKVDIMVALLRSKFQRHEDLRFLLLDTGGRELREGNTWGDTEWGMVGGKGNNKLGKSLMQVRAELQG